MGLETVELLIQFETEFKINVPDQEAEKMSTIEDVSEWFYERLQIYEPDIQVKEVIFNRIKNLLKNIGLTNKIHFFQTLKDVIPSENLEDTWQQFSNDLNLEIPKLNEQDFSSEKLQERKFLGITVFRPKPAFLESNFERLVECVGALNYQQFVDFDKITNLFEIKIAVMGITQYCSGVDIDEIFWKSAFVHDLGMS